jgi:hypothetical protein
MVFSSKLGEHLLYNSFVITANITGLLLGLRKARLRKLRLATGLTLKLVFRPALSIRRRPVEGKGGKEGSLAPLERGSHSKERVKNCTSKVSKENKL